jgi:hypothetical protein
VFLPPSPEAKAIASRFLDRLRERTRADLLGYEVSETTTTRTDAGTVYTIKVFSFLDFDDRDTVAPGGPRVPRGRRRVAAPAPRRDRGSTSYTLELTPCLRIRDRWR